MKIIAYRRPREMHGTKYVPFYKICQDDVFRVTIIYLRAPSIC